MTAGSRACATGSAGLLTAEQGEGLEKDGTSLSQIPTYVTGVPNGTEKVRPPQSAASGMPPLPS